MNTVTRVLAWVVALTPAAVFARDEPLRRHLLQTGWFHIEPQVRDKPLENEVYAPLAPLLGIGPQFTSPGTGADLGNSDALALAYSCFLDEHWVVKFEGGVPADFDLYGRGTVSPSPVASVTLSDYSPLASAKQWSPVLLAQYYLRDGRERLRPYVGLGVTYTWFTDVELNPPFESALNRRFGGPLSLLAVRPGATRVEADADDDIAPVFNVGLGYDLTQRWNLSASVSYTLLETVATIDVLAADGTRLSRSTADLDLNPLVTALLIGYRF